MLVMSESQRQLRRRGIGSSDIAAICGLIPWRSAHDVWLDKRGLAEEQEETLAMLCGKLSEELIAKLYVHQTSASIETQEEAERRGTLVHPKHDWIVATPDRLVHQPADEILEIKWVGWRMAGAWDDTDEEGMPHSVRAQAEWQLEVTDRSVARVPVLLDGSRFRIFTVKRRADIFAGLRAKAERFWFDHVVTGEPPPIDQSAGSKRMLEAVYGEASEELRPATDEAEEIYERLRAAQRTAKSAEAEEELCKNLLRDLIGGAGGVISDTWKATWKTERGRVSWKDVAEAVGASADEIEAHRGKDKRVLRIAERTAKKGRVAA